MVLHGIAWYCIVLHGIAWYCIVLHGIALYCIVLHRIALYRTVSYVILWYSIPLHTIALLASGYVSQDAYTPIQLQKKYRVLAQNFSSMQYETVVGMG